MKEIVPEEIYTLLVNSSINNENNANGPAGVVPHGVTREDYEQSVSNLMDFMRSSNDNFIFELLNFKHPYYSIKAISGVSVVRIASSDLIKLGYKSGDPGICKQTLEILIEVCSRKYKNIKQEGSNTVVKYFESELAKTKEKLRAAEDKLLKYKQENKIINYYEQSKAVAVVREERDLAYQNKLAELAGSKAANKRLAEELEFHGEIEQINQQILIDKENLGKLNYKIVMAQSKSDGSEASVRLVDSLNSELKTLQAKIDKGINTLYSMSNSIDGIPMSRMMPQWINNMINTEDLSAEVDLLTQQSQDFLTEVEKYAPFGANMKKIEREIGVYEKEYSQILHGLNLARLKYQDTQIAGNLVTADPPFFPVSPIPSKRKIIVLAAGFFGFVLLLAIIFVMEFFDKTLKNEDVAAEQLGVPSLGMLPKITRANGTVDMIKVQGRVMDFLMQNFMSSFNATEENHRPKIITVFSTQANEGKTVIAGNIARKIKAYGNRILYLNHSDVEKQKELTHKSSWLYKLLGYNDPRIDYNHPFFDDIKSYLSQEEYVKYNVNDSFSHIKNYTELDVDNRNIQVDGLDYVIVELPNILDQNYSADIFKNSDLSILICRSNRVWTDADSNILENINNLPNSKVKFIVNGVEIEQVETLLGDIPKKRSIMRKKVKSFIRFQFMTKKHI
jgi:uncharacterized protein involved in exopolysaccharide biosynthesis